ncbi:MAG: citramalate synthase, partial [Clostridia bacterium]
MKKIVIYDSTLRDGAQGKNISYTVHDKIKIARKLDELGVDFIEAGNPGSNPKEIGFFEELKGMHFKHARIVAFGSTRRPGISPEEDLNIHNLLMAGTEWVAIFGKSWDDQVLNILKTSLSENLAMISSTVEYLKSKNKKVVFDAEHFFDGYRANPGYAMETLQAAVQAGVDSLCLCDTRGGTFPGDIFE